MAVAIAKMISYTVIAASLLLSGSVIVNAFYKKKQFYPSVVYICKSNISMNIIYFQVLVAVYLLGKLALKIFFGSLRTVDSKRFFKKVLNAVVDTFSTFIIFKDDFNTKFVILYALLLFLKCLHWLAEDRVNYMEQTPIILYLLVRLCIVLILLTLADIYFVYKLFISTWAEGSSLQLVCGFEYALLFTLVANATFKYVIHVIDVFSDTFWESKAIILMYFKCFMGFCKCVMYLVFLIILLWTYNQSIFLIPPIYFNLRSYLKVLRDLRSYHRVIHNMNIHFPDATIQDLQVIENMCLICREEMIPAAAKKLPCNHIFHSSCLCSWFLRNPRCPTCRLFMPVHHY